MLEIYGDTFTCKQLFATSLSKEYMSQMLYIVKHDLEIHMSLLFVYTIWLFTVRAELCLLNGIDNLWLDVGC